jgi:hypothetical protein
LDASPEEQFPFGSAMSTLLTSHLHGWKNAAIAPVHVVDVAGNPNLSWSLEAALVHAIYALAGGWKPSFEVLLTADENPFGLIRLTIRGVGPVREGRNPVPYFGGYDVSRPDHVGNLGGSLKKLAEEGVLVFQQCYIPMFFRGGYAKSAIRNAGEVAGLANSSWYMYNPDTNMAHFQLVLRTTPAASIFGN